MHVAPERHTWSQRKWLLFVPFPRSKAQVRAISATNWAEVHGDKILRLVEAVHLPTEVSVSHCKGHQKGSTGVVQGNKAADQEAKRAALQNNDLIGVATLVPQTNLPETPSYTEGET